MFEKIRNFALLTAGHKISVNIKKGQSALKIQTKNFFVAIFVKKAFIRTRNYIQPVHSLNNFTYNSVDITFHSNLFIVLNSISCEDISNCRELENVEVLILLT